MKTQKFSHLGIHYEMVKTYDTSKEELGMVEYSVFKDGEVVAKVNKMNMDRDWFGFAANGHGCKNARNPLKAAILIVDTLY